MKRLLLVVLLLLLGAAPARADDISQAASALRSSPVYQAPGVNLVDVGALTTELSGTDPRVLLAVLPSSAASSDQQATSRAIDIGRTLGDSNAVVLVITEDKHFGTGFGHAAAARGVNSRLALAQALNGVDRSTLNQDGVTALVTSFAEAVTAQASGGGAAGNGSPSSSSTSSHNGAWVLGGLLLIGGGVAAGAAWSSRRRKARLLEGLRAEVEQLYERLGSDVATLDPGEDKVAKQALADASERFNACGAALAEADSPAELAAARRTAVEGLTASRTARTTLGVDPGPPIPTVPSDGPQLTAAQQITVGGETFEGSPEYTPGQPHYFGGGVLRGQPVPGGWYSTPFWEPFLLGTILTGGLGGLGGVGGGGVGGGGDWSGAGGSGGGDWGGGGGGGDWGGGGGGSGGGGGGDF